jgi:hypothetical protein
MPTEPARRYASLSVRRGREAYIQIRTQLHRLRSQHIEPLCVWVNQATADDMHALWFEVTAVTGGRSGYDGNLPSVAGVAVRVGMTGGSDYAFEYHETRALDHAMRDAKDAQGWRVVDNPLDGTH